MSFYFIEPLRKYLGDQSLTLRNNYLFLLVVGLLLLIFIFYILSYKQIVKNNISLKTVFIFFSLFNLTLLFIWPIGSSDIFSYIYQSRILSEYQANPYFVSYDTFTHDSFYHIIRNKWSMHTMVYGPLWVIIGSVLSFIGNNSLLFTLFLFKLFFIVINFLNFYFISKISKNIKAIFLYAWNPLILYEFALNGHNDVLIVFFILISLFFFLQQNKIKNYILAWIFLLFSVLIKFYTIIFLPFFFLIPLFKLKNNKEKLYFSLSAVAIVIIMPIIFFSPFGNNLKIFQGIKAQLSHSSVIFSSIIISILSCLFSLLNINNYFNWAKIISRLTFIIFYCGIIIRLFLNYYKLIQNNVVKYSFFIYALLLMMVVTWLMPWYLILLIILLILNFKNSLFLPYFKNTTFLYGITLYGILYYIILR